MIDLNWWRKYSMTFLGPTYEAGFLDNHFKIVFKILKNEIKPFTSR